MTNSFLGNNLNLRKISFIFRFGPLADNWSNKRTYILAKCFTAQYLLRFEGQKIVDLAAGAAGAFYSEWPLQQQQHTPLFSNTPHSMERIFIFWLQKSLSRNILKKWNVTILIIISCNQRSDSLVYLNIKLLIVKLLSCCSIEIVTSTIRSISGRRDKQQQQRTGRQSSKLVSPLSSSSSP